MHLYTTNDYTIGRSVCRLQVLQQGAARLRTEGDRVNAQRSFTLVDDSYVVIGLQDGGAVLHMTADSQARTEKSVVTIHPLSNITKRGYWLHINARFGYRARMTACTQACTHSCTHTHTTHTHTAVHVLACVASIASILPGCNRTVHI